MNQRKGIIAAGHEKTAEAARQILEEGGNAFDAAVGAAFAASAAEPVFTSLGGGGFLLAHTSQGKELLYDFFVQTPRQKPEKKSLDFFPIQADFGTTTQEFHIGLGSIATPGTVAGLFQIHKDLGSLPVGRVMEPAIRLCREGVIINALQEYLFQVVEPIYSSTPEARKIFGRPSEPGKSVRQGDRLQFPQLADALGALAREGPSLFYRGDLGKRLIEQCKVGGLLSSEDLASYRVDKQSPHEFDYRGNRILTNPPPSCGGLLIAFTLKLFEEWKILRPKEKTPQDLSALAWAMELTNQARQEALSAAPHWDKAAPLLFRKDFLSRFKEQIAGHPAVRRGTTHLNVLDAEGNMASMSLSNGEGCGHILKDTGIMLNNMLGEEDLSPGGFHRWPVNRRMSSMMAPTLLFKKDGSRIAMGSGGSNRIRTAIAQVLINLVDYGLSIEEAVSDPRIHYERGLLSLEPGFPEETVKALRDAFPNHQLWNEKNLFFGGVHTVGTHPERGFFGAGDPRRAGVCLSV
jgi:gamma-glutamyltranspeptidase / glutathione hydrolase